MTGLYCDQFIGILLSGVLVESVWFDIPGSPHYVEDEEYDGSWDEVGEDCEERRRGLDAEDEE